MKNRKTFSRASVYDWLVPVCCFEYGSIFPRIQRIIDQLLQYTSYGHNPKILIWFFRKYYYFVESALYLKNTSYFISPCRCSLLSIKKYLRSTSHFVKPMGFFGYTISVERAHLKNTFSPSRCIKKYDVLAKCVALCRNNGLLRMVGRAGRAVGIRGTRTDCT